MQNWCMLSAKACETEWAIETEFAFSSQVLLLGVLAGQCGVPALTAVCGLGLVAVCGHHKERGLQRSEMALRCQMEQKER